MVLKTFTFWSFLSLIQFVKTFSYFKRRQFLLLWKTGSFFSFKLMKQMKDYWNLIWVEPKPTCQSKFWVESSWVPRDQILGWVEFHISSVLSYELSWVEFNPGYLQPLLLWFIYPDKFDYTVSLLFWYVVAWPSHISHTKFLLQWSVHCPFRSCQIIESDFN